MLKLSNSQRNWVILAIVLWLVLLAGLIFIPKERPAQAHGPVVAPTNSLFTTLANTPKTGGAVTGQILDPSVIYDANTYGGFTTLCPNEPQEIKDLKVEQLELEGVDLDGTYGYVVLIPYEEGTDLMLDQVALNDVDICLQPLNATMPLNYPILASYGEDKWHVAFQ